MTTLKMMKDLLHYRKAVKATDGDKRCGNCSKLTSIVIHNCGSGAEVGKGDRCRAIGLKESRRYQIGANNICDSYINDNAR